jgi:hypothetical protein
VNGAEIFVSKLFCGPRVAPVTAAAGGCINSMSAPSRRTHAGGQPSKGPRRLITAQVGNQMAAEIMANAADLNLSVTEYATLLLARETGHPIPWWVADRLVVDGQLPLDSKGKPRVRRSARPARRLVLVRVDDDGSSTRERSIGFRVPDDIADDVIERADALGLPIGICTTLFLAKQMGRPAPPWVLKKLRDEDQLALGA